MKLTRIECCCWLSKRGQRCGAGTERIIRHTRIRTVENVETFGEQLQITTVRFGSRAAKARIEQGYDIVSVKVPNQRLSAHWFYLPGLAIVVLVWLTQGWRMRKSGSGPDLLERDAHAA